MSELIRTKVDKFKIEEALSFEDLEKNKDNIEKYLIKMEEIFKDLEKVYLSERKRELFLNGVNLKGFNNLSNGVYRIYCDEFVGLGIVKDGFLKRDVVC